MRYVTVSEFGFYLGLTGNRLTVTDKNGKSWETPLSRLRSIRIEKNGVSLSSNLILACAARGIRIFFTDWRNISVAILQGSNQHAVVNIREAQFKCIHSIQAYYISSEIIISKIRNQRAVILYFGKYLSKTNLEVTNTIKTEVEKLDEIVNIIKNDKDKFMSDWRNKLMGFEGKSAVIYWESLTKLSLLPQSFTSREGRGSVEITNAALNYGYTILQSYIWSALDNAGLELYAGLLHAKRIGRASLVMDFMEEYRAWVVDRNIIRLRSKLQSKTFLDQTIKKEIISLIDTTMSSSISYHNKKVKLENVLQRQAYRLAGAIAQDKTYKGIKFKW